MSATCDYCNKVLPVQKRRRGSQIRFCPGGKCRIAYHNALVKKGKAIIRKRIEKKPAMKKEPKVVDLYSIPVADRPQLLANVARKLGFKEEGPIRNPYIQLKSGRQIVALPGRQQGTTMGISNMALEF